MKIPMRLKIDGEWVDMEGEVIGANLVRFPEGTLELRFSAIEFPPSSEDWGTVTAITDYAGRTIWVGEEERHIEPYGPCEGRSGWEDDPDADDPNAPETGS